MKTITSHATCLAAFLTLSLFVSVPAQVQDCVRFENGMQTARNVVNRVPVTPFGLVGALGCEEQLDTNFFEYVTRIDNRRVWADKIHEIEAISIVTPYMSPTGWE